MSIASVVENFDTATPQGRMIFRMFGSFAELEVATINRMHGSMREHVKTGRLYKAGATPYAYGYSKKDEAADRGRDDGASSAPHLQASGR